MEIDLDLLKFHSFKCNKILHNMVVEEDWNYFDDIFFKAEHCLQKILNFVKQSENLEEFKNRFLHYHEIKDKYHDLIKQVIDTCHPNLKNDLDQKFEMAEKIKFYQLMLDKVKRLIFVFYKNLKGEITFAPVLFDFNHCFYQSKKYNYDNNISWKFLKKWDFKDKQHTLKEQFFKNITTLR